jgi:hypothetical protein
MQAHIVCVYAHGPIFTDYCRMAHVNALSAQIRGTPAVARDTPICMPWKTP